MNKCKICGKKTIKVEFPFCADCFEFHIRNNLLPYDRTNIEAENKYWGLD